MRRDGFVLLAALWVVAVISIAMLQFGLQARSQRLTINNRTELLRARIAAEGGFAVARARLDRLLAENTMATDPWHGLAESRLDTLHISDTRVIIRILDAGSMLHPLGLDTRRLVPFFLRSGADSTSAHAAAKYVAASSSSRDVLLLAGCTGAGEAEQPGPHASPVVESTVARVLPMMLCVGTMRINVHTAPPPVLMSLPGMSDAAVAALVQRRSMGRLSSVLDVTADLRGRKREEFLDAVGALLAASTTEISAAYVSIEAQVDGSPNAVRMDAVLVRSGGSVRTVWKQLR